MALWGKTIYSPPILYVCLKMNLSAPILDMHIKLLVLPLFIQVSAFLSSLINSHFNVGNFSSSCFLYMFEEIFPM